MVRKITKQDKLAKHAPLGNLKPGWVSAMLPVPAQIPRPEYMFHDGPEHVIASDIESSETIGKVRIAGRITADTIVEASKHTAPGVTADTLDRMAHGFIYDHGTYPSYLGYMGLPKSICTSINKRICHGIPDDRLLEEGNIINLDITVYRNGAHGGTCAMFPVGEIDEGSRLLCECTREVILCVIKVYKPGRSINVIDRMVESYAARLEYRAARDFIGHGVGGTLYFGLIIPHYNSPMYNAVMEENIVFTVKPMLTLGLVAWNQWSGDRIVVTKDRGRPAQYEHTIVVTEDGGEIPALPSSQTG